MDIDDIFTDAHAPWRDRVKGEALKLCEQVEERIEAGDTPSWANFTEALKERGFDVGRSTVSQYYRDRYPQLRRDK